MHASDETAFEPQDEATLTNDGGNLQENLSNINLEELICPICMDYCNDVVESECHHRFCNHCLNRWINSTTSRRCPTCRRNIGSISKLPQLDISISNRLRDVLGEDEFRHRETVRTQNYTYNFTDEDATWRQHASALMERIRETRERIQEIQNEQTAQNQVTRERLSERLMHTNELLQSLNTQELPSEPSTAYHNNRSTNSTEPTRSMRFRTNPTESNRSYRPPSSSSQNRMQINVDEIISEYSYHLRRAESAHVKIKVGNQELDFHNSHLKQLYEAFLASHQQGRNSETHLDYEEYEILQQEENRNVSTLNPRLARLNREPSDSNNNPSRVSIPYLEFSRQMESRLRKNSNRLNFMRRIRREYPVQNEPRFATNERAQAGQSITTEYESSQSGTNRQATPRERRFEHLDSTIERPDSSVQGRDRHLISRNFLRATRGSVFPTVSGAEEINYLSSQSGEQERNIHRFAAHRRSTTPGFSAAQATTASSRLQRGSNSSRNINLRSPRSDQNSHSDHFVINLPPLNLFSNVPERDVTTRMESSGNARRSTTFSTTASTPTTMTADDEEIRESLQELLDLDAMLRMEIPVRENDSLNFEALRRTLMNEDSSVADRDSTFES